MSAEKQRARANKNHLCQTALVFAEVARDYSSCVPFILFNMFFFVILLTVKEGVCIGYILFNGFCCWCRFVFTNYCLSPPSPFAFSLFTTSSHSSLLFPFLPHSSSHQDQIVKPAGESHVDLEKERLTSECLLLQN